MNFQLEFSAFSFIGSAITYNTEDDYTTTA